ncbi:NADP-dependent oxidoreductase [Nocardioides sp. cx-173]|uniref:NADP-dependent oxidoreductase n=1 Tax=Nocardioides sp. cx-173 TaxID=2898796 RepID=UPI001E6165AF|nr:NADP-dependent oxidoreductase [Nocardioides sp. cx-173]MCD4523391.1 NADP-dependent oxidoreductase [Nocardioides sp. cx-173]UGB42270.1 NADP-dependent oxidoreductase [Nocardioides sp. cx-173]
MHAIRFTTYGGPEVLELAELAAPTPGPGQVLIQVAATTFNPVDATIRAGYLRDQFPLELPHVPGIDVSGTVTEVGRGVDQALVGTEVVAFLPMNRPGAAADYAVAPAELVATAPRTVGLADAAALPSAGLTAWQALVEHADVQPGQRVLVNGAGGGVGGFAVALATHLGAQVAATASPRSADAVRSAGAHEVIDYTTTSVAEALAGEVDVVLNLVRNAPEELAALRQRISPGGVLVSTTTLAEPDPGRDVRAVAVFVRSDAAQLAHLTSLLDKGVLRLDIGARYPLADLARAHADGEAGRLRGRTVVAVAG